MIEAREAGDSEREPMMPPAVQLTIDSSPY
jgi:hypothetical protein